MSSVGRRLISFSVVGIGLPVAILGAPLWIPIAVVFDLSSRLFKFPTVRLGIFAVVFLVHEWGGLSAALGIKILRWGGWRTGDRAHFLEPDRQVQRWWGISLLAWADRLLGVRFDFADPTTLPTDGFILMSRHASMVDAVLPIRVITGFLDRFVHYVLKRELRWVPNMDVYGHRLGNYFVARNGDGEAEAEAIGALAAQALPDSVLVIFPEGTYSTPARRERIRASLHRNGEHDLVELTDRLVHLLPPKPAGALALLRSQPTLDVVIFGHVGLEGVAELSGLRQRLPLSEPVVVRWWTHQRSTVPTTDEGRIDWLNDQWRTLDRWVDSVHRAS